MADDINANLRALANRWAMKARDFARSAKEAGVSESQAAYDRGFAEAYYRAATELAELLKEQSGAQPATQPTAARPVSGASAAGASVQRQGAPVPPAAPATAAAPVPPAPSYAEMPLREAYEALEYGGCQPQEITLNKDNSFRATFSSWGKMMLHEQVNCVQASDHRIIVLNSGKLESHDYFIEFAFKKE